MRQATALQHVLPQPYESQLRAVVNFRFMDGNQGDLDNLLKSIFDGMAGVAYKNDRQIKKIDTEIFIEPNMPASIEVILMRHKLGRWADRISIETLEFMRKDLDF